MNKKMTPWFPGNVKPVRPGVYNVSCRSSGQTGNWYGRFDGNRWYGNWGDSPSDPIMWPMRRCWKPAHEGTPTTWRGLAKEPK